MEAASLSFQKPYTGKIASKALLAEPYQKSVPNGLQKAIESILICGLDTTDKDKEWEMARQGEAVMLGLKSPGVGLALLMLIAAGPVWAANDSKTLQVTAHIRPRASLTLSHTQVTFDGQEDQPVITTLEGPVKVTAKGRASGNHPLTLTVRANGDLAGPNGNIPIQQVEWRAQSEGLRSGTLTRAGDQLVGQWTKSGINQGEIDFFLRNTGKFQAGDFSSTFILTLSSP